MRFSLDTGDPEELLHIVNLGFPIRKITTNPTSISKYIRSQTAAHTVYDVAMRMAEISSNKEIHEISVETLGTPTRSDNAYIPYHLSHEIIEEEAERIYQWSPLFVAKIPSVAEGFKATNNLKARFPDRKINLTLGFDRIQGLHAANTGADYYSIFVGRYDDIGLPEDGIDIARAVMRDYHDNNILTEVLIASVRNLSHITMLHDADIITAPASVYITAMDEMGKADAVAYFHKLAERPFIKRTSGGYFKLEPFSPNKLEHLNASERLANGLRRFLEDAQKAEYRII